MGSNGLAWVPSWLAVGLALACAGASASAAGLPDQDLEKLAQSSLEDLMQIKVSTVTGTPQSRISSPAAVYIVSSEDIRRSGHRTVAEALRLIPGMYVAQTNSSSWLTGSRGLTGSALTSTRYLVLVDGRLVYDPLTSTTFWDSVDTLLEDVDRIEVIRGPGATLWGANAMNGVINIITKASKDTQGTLVQVGAGTRDPGELAIRHGARSGDDATWRVWAKFASHGDFDGPTGATLHYEWSNLTGGFRYDREVDARTTLTLSGDAYTHPRAMESVRLPVPGRDREFQQVTGNASVSGANLLMQFNRGFGEDNGWRLRAYHDQTSRQNARFGVDRQTADLDLRVWSKWSPRNDLMWGAEYLWTRDRTRDGPVLYFDPADRSWFQFNAFVQNTTELVDGKLFAMLGSKFTYHSFAGFQAQPSARLWWTPSDTQTWWAAVSRPVRMPSRFEENGTLVLSYFDLGAVQGGAPNGVILPVTVSGDPSLRPERLLAYEVGHRINLADRWMIETSVFYNDYRRLIEPGAAVFVPFTDTGSGSTSGAEINASGQVSDRWRLEAAYSWLDVNVDGPVYQFEEKSSPRQMAQLRSYLDISDRLEFNAALYHVDRIEQLNVGAYNRLDLGLSWRPAEGIRLDLWGQNLLDHGHPEGSGAMVPRSLQALASFDLGH